MEQLTALRGYRILTGYRFPSLFLFQMYSGGRAYTLYWHNDPAQYTPLAPVHCLYDPSSVDMCGQYCWRKPLVCFRGPETRKSSFPTRRPQPSRMPTQGLEPGTQWWGNQYCAYTANRTAGWFSQVADFCRSYSDISTEENTRVRRPREKMKDGKTLNC